MGAHMINRLDRETSGPVLIAKDKETAGSWRVSGNRARWSKPIVRWFWMPEGDTFEIHAHLGKTPAVRFMSSDARRWHTCLDACSSPETI